MRLGVKDELMAKFGIASRFDPKFEYETYINSAVNEYVYEQLKRLKKQAVENPDLY